MIIVRSPLRITLGGGGTDLPSYYREYGGVLVAAAIDLLRRAIEDGIPRATLRDDPDLKPLANAPAFRKWLQEAAGESNPR